MSRDIKVLRPNYLALALLKFASWPQKFTAYMTSINICSLGIDAPCSCILFAYLKQMYENGLSWPSIIPTFCQIKVLEYLASASCLWPRPQKFFWPLHRPWPHSLWPQPWPHAKVASLISLATSTLTALSHFEDTRMAD